MKNLGSMHLIHADVEEKKKKDQNWKKKKNQYFTDHPLSIAELDEMSFYTASIFLVEPAD